MVDSLGGANTNAGGGFRGRAFGKGQGVLYRRDVIPPGKGIDLTAPSDQLSPERYPYGKNIRAYGSGGLQPRPGLSEILKLANIHSIYQLRNSNQNIFKYLLGAGTNLYFGNTTAEVTTPVLTGLSGNPLMFVDTRPEQTPDPWIVIADVNINRAINSAGTVIKWGIDPPIEPPSLVLSDPPNLVAISDCELLVEYGSTWNNSVGAGSISVDFRTNTTVNKILYDSGSVGYCLIEPTTIGRDIQPNQRLKIGGEYTVVQQLLPAIVNANIAGVLYDAGSTGLCTIQLDNAVAGLAVNSLVQLVSTGEYVRVLEVVDGLDNKPCFRCFTTLTVTALTGVVGKHAIRCYLSSTVAPGAAMVGKCLVSNIDPTVGTPKGIGNIRLNAARDFSIIGTKTLRDDDEISCGVYIDDINRLIEGRLMFDVDPGTTTTPVATDFSKNYFFYTFRKSDLQAFADFNLMTSLSGATPGRIQQSTYDQFNTGARGTVRNLQTGEMISYDQYLAGYNNLAATLPNLPKVFTQPGSENNLLEKFRTSFSQTDGTPPPLQIGSGKGQWYQLTFRVSDLERSGTDKTKTLRDVKSVMLSFQLTTVTPAVQVGVAISSIWIGGGSNLDSYGTITVPSEAYYYRVTGWNDETGDESLASPASRIGIIPRRQQTVLTIPNHPDTQITHLNIYRYGGTLRQWLYLGRVANPTPGGTTTFTDNLKDESIAGNKLLTFDKYAPFPIADRPLRGTCDVVGNRVVWKSNSIPGDTRKFDLSYAPGTEIIIDGKAHLLYRQPYSSGELLELAASAGVATGVTFYMPNPIKLSQPLPYVIGPYTSESEAVNYFAFGDKINPGYLYWMNDNNPNATTDANYIEVSSPAEPLVAGCVYDGRVYIASAERMWQVTPSRSYDGSISYKPLEIANSKGVIGPWSITVDQYIYFVGKDGIYRSEGGQPTLLTKEDLYQLFPHDDRQGKAINTIPPPDLTQDMKLRLTGQSQMLYFDYLPVGGDGSEFYTLVFDAKNGTWNFDIYGDYGICGRYSIKGAGATDYRMVVATMSGLANQNTIDGADYGVPFECKLRTLSHSAQDLRAQKIYAEWEMRVSSENSTPTPLTVKTYLDNYRTLLQTDVLSIVQGEAIPYHVDLPEDTFARNIALELSWFTPNAGGVIEFNSFEPCFLDRPETSYLRTTDWEDGGTPGSKFLQGVIIEADTLGSSRVVNIKGDDGAVLDTLTITHDGQSAKTYSLSTPGVTRLMRLEPSDMAKWRIYNITWIFTPYPESATTWQTTPNDLGDCGWKHIPEMYIDTETMGDVESSLTITVDADRVYNFTIPSSQGKMRRYYLRGYPVKGKVFQFKITNPTGVRVFNSSCVHVSRWERGPEDRYDRVNPFGGPTGAQEGAVV